MSIEIAPDVGNGGGRDRVLGNQESDAMEGVEPPEGNWYECNGKLGNAGAIAINDSIAPQSAIISTPAE